MSEPKNDAETNSNFVMLRFAPMLAMAVEEPFDSEEYAFEVKWDGIRCLCMLENGTSRLYSRTGRDITGLFPELADLSDAVAARRAILDGELCVLHRGIPSFHHIQRRNVLSGDAAIRSAAAEHPALYIVFDLLHVDGEDLMGLPWTRRRRRLEATWRGTDHAVLTDAVPARGRDLYAAGVAQGLEGVVAKRLDGPYVPGRRTRHWLKVRHRRELDAVIGGYTPKGRDDLASLAVGLYASAASTHPTRNGASADLVNPSLIYIGNVGTGFSARDRGDIVARLSRLRTETSPFSGIPGTAAAPPRTPPDSRWVHPQLVCRVAYYEFTPGGHLRHPAFLGLRDDKPPRECTFAAQPSASGALRPGGEFP